VNHFVVKVGGAVATDWGQAILVFARDNHVCVVHGAGPQISLEMERAGIPVEFVDGIRVTTLEGLQIVHESLEAVNAALCAAIGDRAVPIFGHEIGFEATPMEKYGLVGDPRSGELPALYRLLEYGKIPVFAPLARSDRGGPYLLNVNADHAAAAIAVNGYDRLVFLTDVEGFILDGEVVDSLDVATAEELFFGGGLDPKILPKLGAAIEAARFGVSAFIGRTEVKAAEIGELDGINRFVGPT
jgi:acetylglutamate kinase